MNTQSRDIDALIELFEASDWKEMHLKVQDFELFLSSDPKARSPDALAAPAAAVGRHAGGASVSTPTLHDQAAAHWVTVTAPNLGTFYRAPKPGSPPFVEIGQAVDPETEICLIEVMKLFTTLKAGVKGILKQACVQDATMVEFGDILFYIEPA